MVRVPVLAAGGIVLRQEPTPLIAVVRLRKRNEWVLPKGKLDDGETARAAAEREVLEETGHDVAVHEFLGTLVYESGGKSKVVHYWRMETRGGPTHELMDDVRAVDWLPLEDAVARLSRSCEQAFLANVGPLALQSARPKKAKPPARGKRRGRRVTAAKVLPVIPAPVAPPRVSIAAATPAHEPALEVSDIVATEAPVAPVELEAAPRADELSVAPACAEEVSARPSGAEEVALAVAAETPSADSSASAPRDQRSNLVQKVRDWLRRAA